MRHLPTKGIFCAAVFAAAFTGLLGLGAVRSWAQEGAIPTVEEGGQAGGGDSTSGQLYDVEFVTDPAGAQVTLDGAEICLTPCVAPVAAGVHEMRLVLATSILDETLEVDGSTLIRREFNQDSAPIGGFVGQSIGSQDAPVP